MKRIVVHSDSDSNSDFWSRSYEGRTQMKYYIYGGLLCGKNFLNLNAKNKDFADGRESVNLVFKLVIYMHY